MTLAETIYQHCLALPEPAAREALDFIEFLEQRYGQSVSPIADDDQKRQTALAHIAAVRIHWQDKPIPDRDALYGEQKCR